MKLIRSAYGKYGSDKFRKCHLYKLDSGKGLIIKDNNGHQWSKELRKIYKSYNTALRIFNLNMKSVEVER